MNALISVHNYYSEYIKLTALLVCSKFKLKNGKCFPNQTDYIFEPLTPITQ